MAGGEARALCQNRDRYRLIDEADKLDRIMQLLLLLEEHYGCAIPVGSVSRANFKTARTIAALLATQGYEVLPEE